MKKISIKTLLILLKKAQAVVQKTSRQNVTSTVLIFLNVFLMDVRGGKITFNLRELVLEQKKKKHVHTGKESEAY